MGLDAGKLNFSNVKKGEKKKKGAENAETSREFSSLAFVTLTDKKKGATYCLHIRYL